MTKKNGTTERDEIEELLLALPLTFRRVMMTPNGLWRVDCCLPGIAEPVRQFHHVKLKAALGMAIRFADELERESEDVSSNWDSETDYQSKE